MKRESIVAAVPLLTEHDVANAAAISVASVRRRRLFGLPPAFLKIGASVRYKPEAVAAWLDSCPTGGNAEVA